MAESERPRAAVYRYEDEAGWTAATMVAETEVAKAEAKVAERCQELGSPKIFAPSLKLGWSHRGYDNSLDKRRAELRKVAQATIAALEQRAVVDDDPAERNGIGHGSPLNAVTGPPPPWKREA